MRSSTTWFTLALLGTALLGACGSDDNDSTASTTGGQAGSSVGGPGGGASGSGASDAGGSSGTVSPKAIVDLRADTNRDGKVDLTGSTDSADKGTWDATHGAIFLANIDDDLNACKKTGTDVDLPKCNDAADEVINGPDDLSDLARLKTVPWTDAPDGATGTITTSAPDGKVRLFKNDGQGNFTVLHATDALTTDELRAGVELAIEGTDIVRDDAVWDGYVDLTFTVSGDSVTDAKPDTVRMRLAPVLTHHHLQTAQKVFVAGITGDSGSTAMRADLKAAASKAGVPDGVTELKNSAVAGDQWTQDYFEPGYMAMPSADGLHIVRVDYRSANVYYPTGTKAKTNPLRDAGKVVFTTLRGPDVGGVQQFDLKHDQDSDSLNSFGNLETIPPYTLGDKSYPLGRVFRGNIKSFGPDPSFIRMVESQKQQPPVYVDTSWLLVGHVDETISFVKAATPRGWALVVNDAALAKKMLEDQVTAGNGDVELFVGRKWYDYDSNKEIDAAVSIKDVLADKDVMAKSAEAATEVDNQLAILIKETGLTDDEIIRLPYLHQSAQGYSLAYQPGTVNGIYLSDTVFGAPKPHGPVVGGVDIFEAQMSEAFAKVGITVAFIEDWDLYHRLSGEVHCGTNTYRQVSATEKWWESGF